MLAVLDTNILVSALLSRGGTPARVLSLVFQGELTPCFDWRILEEHTEVLSRPKFSFTARDIKAILDRFWFSGYCALAEPLSDVFIDEFDKKFYEVSKFCSATLITGNTRHFPPDPLVMSPSDFLKQHGDLGDSQLTVDSIGTWASGEASRVAQFGRRLRSCVTDKLTATCSCPSICLPPAACRLLCPADASIVS